MRMNRRNNCNENEEKNQRKISGNICKMKWNNDMGRVRSMHEKKVLIVFGHSL